MVKHGKSKKRRAGRIGRTKLKNRNYAKFKPPQIGDYAIRKNWDPTKSPTVNLHNLGLVARPNADVNDRGLGSSASSTSKEDVKPSSSAVELFDIPESDVIPKKTKALRMLPVSIENQKYMARCMAKHGDDYGKMARDIKVNDMQHTEQKLRKLGSRFLLLTPEQRRVEVPEKVKHLVLST